MSRQDAKRAKKGKKPDFGLVSIALRRRVQILKYWVPCAR
jgi:hypothetical protein